MISAKKISKRIVALFMAFVMSVMIFPADVIREISAGAATVEETIISPAAQTLTYTISNSYKVDYSGDKRMFNGYTEKYSGTGVKDFKILSNYSSQSRVGYIDVKNSRGTVVKSYRIIQQPTFLSLTTTYKGTTISGNGQSVTYTVSSNMPATVYLWGQGVTDKIVYESSNEGYTQTKTFTVKYPMNTTTKKRSVIGVRAQAQSLVQICSYSQAAHTHAANSYKTITDSTCTECGEKSGTCIYCNSYFTTMIYPKGHTGGNSKVIIEPTCYSEGKAEIRCVRCNYLLTTRPVAKKKHTFNYSLKEGKVTALCKVSKCTGHDDDVSYDEYCDYQSLEKNRKSEKSYLQLILNKKSSDIDKMLDAKQSAPKAALDGICNIISLTASNTDNVSEGIGSFCDYVENFQKYVSRSASDTADFLSSYLKWLGWASNIATIIQRFSDGEKTPGDSVAIITTIAGFADRFGVLSRALDGLPDLMDSTAARIKAHYNAINCADILAAAPTVLIAGKEVEYADLSLYQLELYKEQIIAHAKILHNYSETDSKATKKRKMEKLINPYYDLLVDAKESFILYKIDASMNYRRDDYGNNFKAYLENFAKTNGLKK